MDFDVVLDQVRDLLRQRGRLSYGALKRRFDLDEAYLEDIKDELIKAERVAADEDGAVLVWTGDAAVPLPSPQDAEPDASPVPPHVPEAERRQLTVMFCDLVGSTALSEHLDPEELREIVRAYQKASAEVIERFEGHIAQYLGDGLLVYFGYPAAHEDDAARAVRAGLEIVTAVYDLNAQLITPIQVRIGIHTGPVVVGQMGGGSRHEQLALGETPNIAARVQNKAEPGEVVISAATQRLITGLFELEDRGLHELKGISTQQPLYRVTAESLAHNRFEVAVRSGLTPLVGRDTELQFLQQRWERVKEGEGQVVLLSGEPGIGKSRLVQELKEHVTRDSAIPIEFRCSPYHQNSALYPITEHLQQLLQFTPDDTPESKLEKLQRTLSHYRFPQANTLALLAALLSLPHPAGVPPLPMSPQKQKKLTQAALVAWLLEETAQSPVLNAWEDLHWADPSTLELLDLLLTQVPTSPVLVVLTFRPEFVPSWGTHSYLSQLALNRLSHPQVSAMVEQVIGGKALPEEVVEQIVAKTDGVPLFVEELTKMVVESNLVREANGHYELTGLLPSLAIPSTLQDSLMARLDRLATVREVAQLGATIGREFSYELLHAVSPLSEEALQQALQQLVDAELIFQRGLPPQARYTFKHALIQDTAYESLLKSRRQQLHHQLAQVLAERFTEMTETQPEILAHHYTAARLAAQALPYWQRAGERAVQRSAYVEAIGHLSRGLEVLQTLSDVPTRAQHELTLQLALGDAFVSVKGYTAPEVERAHTRARELSQQIGETPQLFTMLWRLVLYYINRGDLQTTHELSKQSMRLAQSAQDDYLLSAAHTGMGCTLYRLGELTAARSHLERAIALYDPQHPRPTVNTADLRIDGLTYLAWTLWCLGYPDQALKRSQEVVAVAEGLSHPFSLAYALGSAATCHAVRREVQAVQRWAEAGIALSREHGFTAYLGLGVFFQGKALAEQGQGEAGLAQMRQVIAGARAVGAEIELPRMLAWLAELYGKEGQAEEGLRALTEALAMVNKNEDRHWEAEVYRLKGELLLMQATQKATREEAVGCFQRALEIARQQNAKSFELRAATSLARLWQQQGKMIEARDLLAPVYNWFTEGFDTADLQEAKALLEALA